MSAILAHSADPIVWLRFARAVMLMVAAAGMFIEPMRCGGRNRVFHRIVGSAFAALSVHSIALSSARAVVLAQSPGALAGIDLLASELLVTVAGAVVMTRLVYDTFLWRTYHKHGERRRGTCWR